MKKLAIIGHPTRGKEVIEILKMLGGKNEDFWKGKNPLLAYYINDRGEFDYINNCNPNENILRYTLEEFLEKYPYKIGDRVRVPEYESEVCISKMYWDGNEVQYEVVTDEVEWYSAKELNEFNELNKEETMEDNKLLDPNSKLPSKYYDEIQTKRDMDKTMFMLGHTLVLNKMNDKLEYEIIDGYEFDRVDNNKIILKPIKPKYPKTYKECCEILDLNTMNNDAQGYEADLIIRFQELLIARNAYWKIIGDEMGLDKPWEPDFKDNQDKYFICYLKDEIWRSNIRDCNRFLVFPTEKIRDEFYENFKDLIKSCKNLI